MLKKIVYSLVCLALAPAFMSGMIFVWRFYGTLGAHFGIGIESDGTNDIAIFQMIGSLFSVFTFFGVAGIFGLLDCDDSESKVEEETNKEK